MRDAICDAEKRSWDGLEMSGVKLDAWRVKDRNWAVAIKYGLVDSWMVVQLLHGPKQAA